MRIRNGRRTAGGALLAVLWLCAALSAIAFSVANTVRGEMERASTGVDSLRAHYMAAGAVDRAMLWFAWGAGHRNPDGSPRFWEPGMARLVMPFPSGMAVVEIIPESSKLDINRAPPEDLQRLLLALGLAPDRAQEIAAGIVDWRSSVTEASTGRFVQPNAGQGSSFQPPHASFRETEELLFVKGMTPEIYHGSYSRDVEGRLIPHGALKDCVSVWGSTGPFDVNTVEPAVMAAIGVPPGASAQVVEMRRQAPFRTAEQFAQLAGMIGPSSSRLTIGMGARTFTVRATATVRGANGQPSGVQSSVAALMRVNDPKEDMVPIRVLRWYDNVWVDSRGRR